MTILYCPICGFGPFSEPYKTNQEIRESFDICPCCGCEYGYDDNEAHYKKWSNSGFSWFNAKFKPEGWDIESQLTRQIRPWPPTCRKT